MPYMIQDSVTQFYTDKAKPLKKNHMINFNLYGEDKKSTIGIILSFDNEIEGLLKSFSL